MEETGSAKMIIKTLKKETKMNHWNTLRNDIEFDDMWSARGGK